MKQSFSPRSEVQYFSPSRSLRCLARGVVKPGYILHHKIKLEPWNIDDQSVTLNPANLEYVCLDCHNADELGEHSGTGPRHKPRRARFDSAGRLLPP